MLNFIILFYCIYYNIKHFIYRKAEENMVNETKKEKFWHFKMKPFFYYYCIYLLNLFVL